jgi:hypothetical protein
LLSRAGKLPAQRQGGNEDTSPCAVAHTRRSSAWTPTPRTTPRPRRGLAGLPLPGAGERHGIANGHMLAAIVDQVLLVPVAKPEGVDLGAAQRTGRRGAGGKFDQGHGRRKLAVACLAAVTLTQRESKAPRGPRVSLRCPTLIADRVPRRERFDRPAEPWLAIHASARVSTLEGSSAGLDTPNWSVGAPMATRRCVFRSTAPSGTTPSGPRHAVWRSP